MWRWIEVDGRFARGDHALKNGPLARAVPYCIAAVDQLTPTALQAEATPLYCAEPEP
jgi:hypothetical protein